MQLFTRLTSHLKRMRRLQIIALIILLAGAKGYSQNYPMHFPLDSVPVLQVQNAEYVHDSLSWMYDIHSLRGSRVLSISTDNWRSWRNIKVFTDKFEVTGSDTLYLYRNGIYRTTNFGETWELLEGTSTYKEQYAREVLDLEYHKGILLAIYYDLEDASIKAMYSPDGGETFTTQDVASAGAEELGWKIKAQSASKWWIYSSTTGIFRYTEDAGQTWKELPYNIIGTKLHVLGEDELVMTNGFRNTNNIITGRMAAVSSDGGNSWHEKEILYPFSDSMRVFRVGNWIWYTDGTSQDPTMDDPYIYNDFSQDIATMYMVQSTKDIYVILENGKVYVSSDQMRSFEDLTEVNPRSYINMTGDTGISLQGRIVYKTFDGGKNWDTLNLPGGYFNQNFIYHSPDSVFIATYNNAELKIYFTSDLGESYTVVDSVDLPSGKTHGKLRQNKDGSFLYKSGAGRLFLLNSGTSTFISEDPNLEDYNFFDSLNGLVVTRPNSLSSIRDIAITHDGGQTWDTTQLSLPQYGAAVYMLDHGNVILKDPAEGWKFSENDGQTWQTVVQFDDPENTLQSIIWFTAKDSLIIYIENFHDQVFSSKDGGKTWSSEAQWAYTNVEAIVPQKFEIYSGVATLVEKCNNQDKGVTITDNENELSINDTLVYFEWINIPDSWIEKTPEVNRMTASIPKFDKGSYHVYAIDSRGCFYHESHFVQNVTSLEEEFLKQTSVYPVPSFDGIVHVTTELEIQNLNLYDQTGRLVKTLDPAQPSHSVSDLDSGIYILKISTQEGELSKRISIFN